MTHNFHQSIIRAYDIRGVYNQTLFDLDAYFVGKAFGTFLAKKGQQRVVVACDGRVSSPALKENLIKGLMRAGMHVTDVGVGPTPMLYFSVYHLGADGGIMVTGSHNPGSHNGFKMLLRDRPFFGDDIVGLARIAADGRFIDSDEGRVESKDISQDYIERLLSDCVVAESESDLLDEIDEIEPKRKLKIAWDAGNGAAGEIMKRLSDRIAAEHFLLFEDIDGTFPNHHPDPTVPSNLQDLIKKVRDENCDLGIAFDGDGDRIGVVDDEGQILWGDQLLVFYAREILSENKGATIIADVKASNVLFDEVKRAGGNPLMWRTGHSLIKAKMKETKSPLAGEMSGHIFFADKYYGFDDALYAAIRTINIVQNSSVKLSTLRKSLPRTFSTPEIRVDCSDDKKFQIVEDLKSNLKKSGVEFNDVDGVRAFDKNGWWLIRASNTQPVLVARAEAFSSESLVDLKNNLKKHLESCQVEIPVELK